LNEKKEASGGMPIFFRRETFRLREWWD